MECCNVKCLDCECCCLNHCDCDSCGKCPTPCERDCDKK